MQIGLALHNYEMAHETLPPGTVNPTGPIRNEPKGYHMSWTVQILPYIEQQNVYRHIDFASGIYADVNASARIKTIPVFLCASNPAAGSAKITYAGCHNDIEAPIDVNNNGVLYLNSAVRYHDIRDGSSNTIYVGEHGGSSEPMGWSSGTRATLRNTGARPNSVVSVSSVTSPAPAESPSDDSGLFTVGTFASNHTGGAHFLIGDGSVRFISENINLTVFQHLGHRADGEMIGDF
jgi:hypothetical protein